VRQFINTASGSNFAIGKGLDSCTSELQVSEQFELDGRSVKLIDTPGFDDSALSDVDVLEMIATFLGAR
jgi:predicted GTPase